MRTTVRIDDDLAIHLRELAAASGESFTRALNHLIRQGLAADLSAGNAPKPPFVQKTYAMGQPRIDVNKSLSIADAWDDEERIARMARHGVPEPTEPTSSVRPTSSAAKRS